MLEKYYKYRVDYKDYLILIKSGVFYECISKDALIMDKIFGYKIKKLNNTFRSGFPVKNIASVIDILEKNNLNYIIVNNDAIEKKYECDNNKYSNYNFDMDLILYDFVQIEKIIKYLSDNILDENISKKINIIIKTLEE